MNSPDRQYSLVTRCIKACGPGFITGAADDDPSGIVTYSIAGAKHGTSLLWIALVTWPLMAAVQMMCARIGMMSGMGLAGALKQKFPRKLIIAACVLLLLANTINIAADLAAMGEVAAMLTDLPQQVFVILFGMGLCIAVERLQYCQIARVLKWLALSLFAYVITGFLLRPDWGDIAKQTLMPSIHFTPSVWETLVAILGTTISPYLFFWQASLEVEEEKENDNRLRLRPKKQVKPFIIDRMLDVGAGTFFSNLVMFFIILTTALTLHEKGMTDIASARQASEALKPLAGELAMALYAAGILGVGLLAIPTLAASSAFAFAETFDWKCGLNRRFTRARAFYAVILLSTLGGMGLGLIHINPSQALFYAAIVNGVLAPFLMIGILLIARDKTIMHQKPSSPLNWWTVALTTLLMFAACTAMLLL